ncbi:MAG: SirB1 family protein [Acidimicrobiia bacterium]
MDPTARLRSLLHAGPPGFPLDEAALLIAAHERPALDLPSHLATLDLLADAVPEASFPALVGSLFGPGGFTGNTTDYYDPDNSLLDAVLSRRIGIPILLAVVAMEVGRRRGVPVLGIGMPGHFLIRSASDPDLFADPFSGPDLFDHDGCRVLFSALTSEPSRWNDAYLAPTSRRDIIVRILNNLKAIHQQRNDYLRLGKVMRMRSVVPGLGEREQAEFRRLMAPMN